MSLKKHWLIHSRAFDALSSTPSNKGVDYVPSSLFTARPSGKGLQIIFGQPCVALGSEHESYGPGWAINIPQDIDILNEILGTEHEGIAAYQVCFDDGMLQKNVAHTARIFQSHHKAHRDILSEKIMSLGGTPAVAKTQNEYRDDLNIAHMKTQKDALNVLVGLELGAANGYIGMLPSTNDHELAKVAGRIAADEVIHWTTWATHLGIALPAQALSFGA